MNNFHKRVEDLLNSDKLQIILGYVLTVGLPDLLNDMVTNLNHQTVTQTEVVGEVAITTTNSNGSGLIGMVIALILAMLALSYQLALLRRVRGETFTLETIVEMFKKHWIKLIFICLLSVLLVSLAMFVMLMIAGIMFIGSESMIILFIFTILSILLSTFVVNYVYGMAHFLAEDYPEKSSIELLTLSRTSTKGKRLKLFLIDIYYYKWIIIPIAIGLYFTVTGNIVLMMVTSLITAVLSVFILPRYYLARTLFFDEEISVL